MSSIEIRGTRVHNLRDVDVDIPLNRLTVITGVSGSGKSSLAFDTLAAEGQRRYVESFSATARQHLDRLDKPNVDRIDNLPPAVGLGQNSITRSRRATVATVTEFDDLLRVLLSRIGTIRCPDCEVPVESDSPGSVADWLAEQTDGLRYQVTFPVSIESPTEANEELKESGFTRLLRLGPDRLGETLNVADLAGADDASEVFAVVDRLATGKAAAERLLESLESCFANGNGRCIVFLQADEQESDAVTLDGRSYRIARFSSRLECQGCQREFLQPEPRLLSFRSPLGACPACEGIGQRTDGQTCEDCSGTRLRPEALAVGITAGDLFSNVSQLSSLTVSDLLTWLDKLTHHLANDYRAIASELFPELTTRLNYLHSVGLGYLTLNRPIASLSRGEAQRVTMTGILGSRLVNTLFVLDEPSAGLHARDVAQIVRLVEQLRDESNTVVVVEHEPEFESAADCHIRIGPGAGSDGGQVVSTSSPAEGWLGSSDCEPPAKEPLGARCARPQPPEVRENVSPPEIGLTGCQHHTIDNVDVAFPLGCLCVVSGVSGAGKSSLVEDILYPALCERLEVPCQIDDRGSCEELSGAEHIAAVELVDDTPLKGGRRSSPVTWLKAFGPIRSLFAETGEARNRNLSAGQFSFNSDQGGRCPKCRGTGSVEIDMQFLADVVMTCPDCHGSRFQRHVLEVTWRGRSIADVLQMTAAEAFTFFRGQPTIQKKLRSLKDVGLDYLTLGQPLSTLSGGEAQRLKLAASLATTGRAGSLLILNEPTTGLHPSDVRRLLECFDGLIAVGHSLIVIEHHLDVIAAADHIIDMGPEAGPDGGRIVVSGSVADVTGCPESITGNCLQNAFRRSRRGYESHEERDS